MELHIPPGPFSGYIFDLDGTLIDSMPMHYIAWSEALKQHGLGEKLSEDLFYALGGVPSVDVAARFAKHHGLTLSNERVTALKEQIYLERLTEMPLIAPVVEFARRISKTHPVSIATGGLAEIALPAIRAAGLDGIFKIIVTPAEIPPGRCKPAPDIFLKAAELMGVAPEKCLVFEDAEPGLVGAKAAGMSVVRVASRK
ncbi:HAD family hydrolase [Nibricoccus sp. IMCC34717]|uniref:HAD family hydrolase n=1 Tax=Nibricoccus sp. IMCC34717 TaxID=3034021 RepID=UPI00384CA9F4